MNRPIKLIIIMLTLIIGLSIVKVSVENSMSTTGAELSHLQDEVDKYKKENSLLKERYLTSASLTEIASKAATTGFASSSSEINLAGPLPLAVNR